MDTLFYLVVNINTPQGMLEVGRFFLGANRYFANETWAMMEGSSDSLQYPSIRLDLVETKTGALPVCHKSIGCNLDQYAANCKILTREVFRHFMFDERSYHWRILC